MSYALTPGGAMRIRGLDEPGEPEEVRVDRRVARRAKFVRLQWFDELIHAVFRDDASGEVYMQPVPDQEGL